MKEAGISHWSLELSLPLPAAMKELEPPGGRLDFHDCDHSLLQVLSQPLSWLQVEKQGSILRF